MLTERRDELLDEAVAAALSSRLEAAPDDPALVFHAALLDLARMDRADLAFDALAAPEGIPRCLAALARTEDLRALEPLTRGLLRTEQPDRVQALIWLHRAIALAVDEKPADALDALREARTLDPTQVPDWLGLIAELGAARPALLPLGQALVRRPTGHEPDVP